MAGMGVIANVTIDWSVIFDRPVQLLPHENAMRLMIRKGNEKTLSLAK
jgi:hypothetical protein